MAWITDLVDRLQQQPVCGYYDQDSPGSEPTALAALALIGHQRSERASPALDWLRRLQSDEGSVGVREGAVEPRWTSSLAALAWAASLRSRESAEFRGALRRAVAWILEARGAALEPPPGGEWPYGHDTTLVAWPWVNGTHSWMEPTCLHLLALRAAGSAEHPRAREAVRLLFDRLLPGGGCNYGNTYVLGQKLRPHVQPSGLAAAALAGERSRDERLENTLNYLQRTLDQRLGAASLAWAQIGLAAHDRQPEQAEQLLARASQRELSRPRPSPYRLALLALAAVGRQSPLLSSSRQPSLG